MSLSPPPTDSISSVCSWLGDIVPTLSTLSCPTEVLLSPTAVRFDSAEYPKHIDTAASTNLDESNLGIKPDLGFQHNPCLLGDPHSILPTEEVSRSLLPPALNTSRAAMAPHILQSTIPEGANFPMTAVMPSGLIDQNDITGMPQEVRLPPCPEGGLYALDTMTAPQSSVANMEVTWDQVVGMYPAIGFSNPQSPDVEAKSMAAWDFVNNRTPFYDQIHSRHPTKAPLPDGQTKQAPTEQYNRRHTQPQLWVDDFDFLHRLAWENGESQSNFGIYACSQRQRPHLQHRQQPQMELQSYINIGPNPNLKQAHHPFLPSSPTLHRRRQYKPHSIFVASPTPLLKRRRRLTPEESEFLLHQFRINERPTAQEREAIAKYLKLDKRTIQVWFQNRRAKLKRDERDEGDGSPYEEHGCERLRAQGVKTDLSPAVSEDVADDEDGSETEVLTSINTMENEGLNLDDALEDYYWLESETLLGDKPVLSKIANRHPASVQHHSIMSHHVKRSYATPSATPPTPNPSNYTEALGSRKRVKAKNTDMLYYTASILIGTLGLSYAAVPLYRMFCSATGLGGAPMVGETKFAPERLVPRDNHRRIKVRFNADTSTSLQWSFQPQQRQVSVLPGETALAFYTAKNKSKEDVIGIATYNVTPSKVAPHFNKIQCFCFEEQKLMAGEEVDMPIFFFLDPEFANDPDMADVDTVVLSYTFFKARGMPFEKQPSLAEQQQQHQ
ncbi:Cytochrome c oxidase assembly protein cox11, mitochondrial [Entomortierella chlamydospora]|uniref:Cytochrome c oxidase assembly protein cox11, mitochondrial n=1 Tax=Entomortierella chlamydospora TaxID=101097 RepID=A0A9P6N2H7_9FUNG|nr:Cytochrome c oxidase assembly protein cox11, mitochondrial [Entomortierella chlamydospora]